MTTPAPLGEACEKADQRVDDRADRADGGECLVGDEVADDPGVHHVVQLLKEVADHERQGKVDDQTRDAALCHIDVPPGETGGEMKMVHRNLSCPFRGNKTPIYHRIACMPDFFNSRKYFSAGIIHRRAA